MYIYIYIYAEREGEAYRESWQDAAAIHTYTMQSAISALAKRVLSPTGT